MNNLSARLIAPDGTSMVACHLPHGYFAAAGLPPGFTAFESESITSFLPVTMPGPKPPLSASDGGTLLWSRHGLRITHGP
jgi:hypothetical protein